MKVKLSFFSLALVVYFTGLLCVIGVGISFGKWIVIAASLMIAGLYVIELIHAIKVRKLISREVLMYSLAVIVLAEIFVLGFSVAIDMSLHSVPGFSRLHAFAGFLLQTLFIWFSINAAKNVEQKKLRFFLYAGSIIFYALHFIGLLGFGGVIYGTNRLLYLSVVFLIFFYFIFFLLTRIFSNQKDQSENWIALLLSSLIVIFWILRWQTPDLISPGIYRIIFHIGFLMILLPVSILLIKKSHFLTAFILYSVVIDFFFLGFNMNFKYMVNTGMHECIGYNDATTYSVINDPGISNEELFKTPGDAELNDVLADWQSKDFLARRVQLEYGERRSNGDSLKVISHYVDGKKHFGMIRIPAGIDTKKAPILLGLSGGGANLDIVDETYLNRISSGRCREVLNNYITIVPSFRGDMLRGGDFCFRSEGYTGDVWLGAAEDAIAFLEVVKTMYSKNDSTRVLAMGVSRGATVALIIGALSDKLDYIISISTHTNFHNIDVFQKEMVGGDFPRIFFTPETSPENIRKKLIASSPYYFAQRLPAFEIHQGADDQLTTVFHAKLMEQRLEQIGRKDKIYIYEGEGHGHDDDKIVCKSLNDFVAQ
jgi:hypothetical protein